MMGWVTAKSMTLGEQPTWESFQGKDLKFTVRWLTRPHCSKNTWRWLQLHRSNSVKLAIAECRPINTGGNHEGRELYPDSEMHSSSNIGGAEYQYRERAGGADLKSALSGYMQIARTGGNITVLNEIFHRSLQIKCNDYIS